MPEQPADLQGLAISANEIRLTWSPPPSTQELVEHYNIYFNDSHLHQNVRVTTESARTTYLMQDLTANTVYHIQVAAESSRGEGARTPIVQVKTDEYGKTIEIPYTLSLQFKISAQNQKKTKLTTNIMNKHTRESGSVL